jgi:hypothetical protein
VKHLDEWTEDNYTVIMNSFKHQVQKCKINVPFLSVMNTTCHLKSADHNNQITFLSIFAISSYKIFIS